MNIKETKVIFNTDVMSEVLEKMNLLTEKLEEVDFLINNISSSEIKINLNIEGEDNMNISTYTGERLNADNQSIKEFTSDGDIVTKEFTALGNVVVKEKSTKEQLKEGLMKMFNSYVECGEIAATERGFVYKNFAEGLCEIANTISELEREANLKGLYSEFGKCVL